MTGEAGSPRAIRLSALGLFLVLPILALGATAMNLMSYVEVSDVRERQEQLLAQLDARLARLGGGAGDVGDTSSIYLPAANVPLAGAALRQRVTAAVSAAGGRVIETQDVEEIEPDGEDDVRLRITLDVNNAGLMGLMHDLETGLPLVSIESAAVRQLPTGGDEIGDDPVLRVDLGLRGFWRAPT